jgi:hypothetical protein
MDFLDSRKRRAHNIRLMVGYFLMAIVIGLSTVILVYGAEGYGINRKTGEIIQNGLLFADSQPGGTEIYLNGVDQHTSTSARLVLPAGNYTLTLKKDGYRTWERKFVLNEHSIARYVYPFLFPVKPKLTTLKTYSAQPGLITQSPDRHWVLVQQPGSDSQTITFDQYDTANLDQSPKAITLPSGLLTTGGSLLKEVEWSTDNVHVLLNHASDSGDEFVIVDKDHPDQSLNVNKALNVSPTEVSLHNKKSDQLYIYNKAEQTIRLGDLNKKTLGTPILNQVLAYKAYGTSLLTYVTSAGASSGQVMARIWDTGQSYPLYEFNAGDKYLIDAAQFQGHWYYVAGSDKADRINIYKDPLSDIKNPSIGKALPVIALHVLGATKVGFSDNARFVDAQNSQAFGIYDFETDSSYQYNLAQPLDAPMAWMDGHRLIGRSSGNIFVTDFDGTNRQAVSPTSLTAGGYFSRNYQQLLTTVVNDSGVVLQDIDMRAGNDLPKQ